MSVNQPKFVPPGNIRVKPTALVGLKPDGSFAYVALDANGNVKMVGGGGGGGLLTKVVDIGPHSNNGPGDQTKGILDWSAHPIVIVLGVPGKFISVVNGWSQYTPGTSYFVDTESGQFLGLFWGTPANHLPSGGLVSLGLDALNPFVLPTFSYLPQGASFDGSIIAGQSLLFGNGGSPGELTDGDGTVRITVHYTIDDILV